jgi:hypothetical protein
MKKKLFDTYLKGHALTFSKKLIMEKQKKGLLMNLKNYRTALRKKFRTNKGRASNLNRMEAFKVKNYFQA